MGALLLWRAEVPGVAISDCVYFLSKIVTCTASDCIICRSLRETSDRRGPGNSRYRQACTVSC
jgi:uncharacterized membrane protein YiaA